MVSLPLSGFPLKQQCSAVISLLVVSSPARWLFEVGAAHELADRLLSLQLSPNLRTQLGTANRTKALLRFSNNHYIEEVDALLAS